MHKLPCDPYACCNGPIFTLSKGKQTAESKQTSDITKNLKFSYLTTLYCAMQANMSKNEEK